MQKVNPQEFRYFCPVEVRYGDLDPQGHVNNAKYLTFFEHARTQYKRELGLFNNGQSFLEIGVIIANIEISFHQAIEWGSKIKVGVRTERMGNKSFMVKQCVVDEDTGVLYASGEVVLVMFDYQERKTVAIRMITGRRSRGLNKVHDRI